MKSVERSKTETGRCNDAMQRSRIRVRGPDVRQKAKTDQNEARTNGETDNEESETEGLTRIGERI